jgi:hypothetical protein
VNEIIALQVEITGLGHTVAIEQGQIWESQQALQATDAALEPLEYSGSTPSCLTVVASGQFIAFKYLEILCAEHLSSLQGKECDHMACPLQATDRMINVKLCGMRFTKADAAFLV